jgi:hypothetical protein
MSSAVHPLVPGVVRDLNTAERSADAQLEASAMLLATIVRGQSEAGLPFGAMQGALADAGEAITLQLRSRHHIARAHQRLLETALEHKLVPETGHGDIVPWCEPSGELKVVPIRVAG